MVLGPTHGSYSMVFDSSDAAITYASDGRGGNTTTATDSFVRDAIECVITSVHPPIGGTSTLQIIHEDATVAFDSSVLPATQVFIAVFPPDGLLLTGNWYVNGTGSAGDDWTVCFQVRNAQ